jgi:hypothetical protein
MNRLAVSATNHCLTGCVTGEITGMAISTSLARGKDHSLVHEHHGH